MMKFSFIDKYRASGRTTRLVDKYVQELFNNLGEWVRISDHFPGRRANEMLMAKIRRRMEIEHHITLDVDCSHCYLRIPSDVTLRLIRFRKDVLLNR